MLSKSPILACFCCLILMSILQTSYAKKNPPCDPSSCGDIHTISYPFRLKDDPLNCGDFNYELACENNTTFIDLDSHKYRVKAINYHNYTIHLADASIVQNDICSFPNHSVSLRYGSPYSTQTYCTEGSTKPDKVTPITFLSCPSPLNSSLFVETDYCVNRNASISSGRRHSYIKLGNMRASDLKEKCRTDLVVMTSMPFKDESSVSLSEIHASLLYGFELSWFSVRCANCRGRAMCYLDGSACRVIACANLKRNTVECDDVLDSSQLSDGVAFALGILMCVIGYGLAVRIVIGIPFLLGIFIYQFRRRHLSKFDAMEGFLQNQSNLMPMRYSYSDIKKMTTGFRQKLGEGGYGSVYKGKPRSGHDVAVKVRSSLKGNGLDFINEVATIGRIHHTNVVKLVGYCAENSRCALVYDFMPNGSLDKYISSQESAKSLSWQRKHEIVVGVARGIDYLRHACDIGILHFDFKPRNILLDHNFNAKISNFGLTKFYSNKNSNVALIAARGSISYEALELVNRSIGGVSCKADVYYFGMLLMEIVGLNRNMGVNRENYNQYFPNWIYDRLNEGKDIDVGSGDEDIDDCARKIKRKIVVVGLWCIQMAPSDRPSMSRVVEMLEGEDGLLQLPPQPLASGQIVRNGNQTSGTDSSDSAALLYDHTSYV